MVSTNICRRGALGCLYVAVLTIVILECILHRFGIGPPAINGYVMLANAFLHGHVDVQWDNHDVPLQYHDAQYIVEGLLPGLLLMPLVAFFGTSTNEEWLVVALTGVIAGVAWEIARRYGVPLLSRAILCGFLLFGTSVMWCAMIGNLWNLALISTVTFTLLALLELSGKRRAWLVALYAACAAESRFTLVLAIPVYAVMLASEVEPQIRWKRLKAFFLMLVPFALLWVTYNELRWHLPYDIGHVEYFHWDTRGRPIGSPFSWRYLPYELYAFFVRAPDLVSQNQEIQWPYVRYTPDGLSLLWTSPALALAFLAPKSRMRTLLWVAVILTALPGLFYYLDGTVQFELRHALDFEPFLFVLMVQGVRERMPLWGDLLCGFSMFVGGWGLWYWQVFYRQWLY